MKLGLLIDRVIGKKILHDLEDWILNLDYLIY